MKLIEAYHNNYNPDTTSIDLVFMVTDWQGEMQPADDVASISWKPYGFIYDVTFCQKHYGGLDEIIRANLNSNRD